MQLSNEAEKYVKSFGMLFIIAGIIYWMSRDVYSCDKFATEFKNTEHFSMILSKKDSDGSSITISGIDPKTHQPVDFSEYKGFMEHTLNNYNIGDTLLKYSDKYTIVIKRKGKTILIPCECNSNIYVDK